MRVFSKQEIDENLIQEFWTWFKNNQSCDIWQINKAMGTRISELCEGKPASAWFEMGWDMGRNGAYITFWADGTKSVREYFKKLIELAPYDIKNAWMLRVEN